MNKNVKSDSYMWKSYETVDLSNVFRIADWAERMHLNHDPKDTGDHLYRWNIAVYQLDAIYRMLDIGKVENLLWAETCGSALVHSLAAFGADRVTWKISYQIAYESILSEVNKKYVRFNSDYERNNSSKLELYNDACSLIPRVSRQMLYRSMNRVNRFNIHEFTVLVGHWLNALLNLCVVDRISAPIDAVKAAIDMLNNLELRSH